MFHFNEIIWIRETAEQILATRKRPQLWNHAACDGIASRCRQKQNGVRTPLAGGISKARSGSSLRGFAKPQEPSHTAAASPNLFHGFAILPLAAPPRRGFAPAACDAPCNGAPHRASPADATRPPSLCGRVVKRRRRFAGTPIRRLAALRIRRFAASRLHGFTERLLANCMAASSAEEATVARHAPFILSLFFQKIFLRRILSLFLYKVQVFYICKYQLQFD
jgi:hypothetical protein